MDAQITGFAPLATQSAAEARTRANAGAIGTALDALRREVHVWYAFPSHFAACADHWRSLLSEDERQRYARFHFAPDRLSYLAAHALLRLALSHYAALAPEAWQFRSAQRGRPELSGVHGDLPLRFNLSHTDGLVACVIARYDCGIDVECTSRRLAGGHLMRSFAPVEVAALTASQKIPSTEAVLAYWTLKECYAKARGLGLGLPFDKFWFSDPFCECDIRACFGDEIDDEPARWQFALLRPAPSHLCALAVRPPEGRRLALAVRPIELDLHGAARFAALDRRQAPAHA